jgi:hypothetical protein
MTLQRTARRRGEPLVALALVLSAWVGARIALWSPLVPAARTDRTVAAPAERHRHVASDLVRPAGPRQETPAAISAASQAYVSPPLLPPLARSPLAPRVLPSAVPAVPPMQPVAPTVAGGHALLWLAAVASFPVPPGLFGPSTIQRTAPLPAPRPVQTGQRRWSADAWALYRPGGGVGGAAVIPTYGASEVGAVLRYRLAPADAHRVTAYLRETAALNGSNEGDVALGLAARPLPRLPVSVSAEVRASRLGRRSVGRPAVVAVTELAPLALPAGVRAEFYAQAGYVGGAGATAFADGQLRLDRKLLGAGKFELRAGGGAWGGAQKGAARLDVGPSATLGFTAGSSSARLAVDWRFRIAGDAAPASGPALTLSAGF